MTELDPKTKAQVEVAIEQEMRDLFADPQKLTEFMAEVERVKADLFATGTAEYLGVTFDIGTGA